MQPPIGIGELQAFYIKLASASSILHSSPQLKITNPIQWLKTKNAAARHRILRRSCSGGT
jgi:hypothetical protein